MQITRDEWSPLFKDLKARISPIQRRILLSQMIGAVQEITQSTMGKSGQNRPEPWQILKESYAHRWKGGDREPTLLMSDANHSLKNPDLPHLIDSFKVTVTENKATLTNVSPYADVHQKGLGAVPARPYYPVDETGALTPVAEQKLAEIVEEHFEPNPF